MIKIFICLFVGFVFGYILRIREEKHERKMREIDRQANEQALKNINGIQETQNKIFKEIWK